MSDSSKQTIGRENDGNAYSITITLIAYTRDLTHGSGPYQSLGSMGPLSYQGSALVVPRRRKSTYCNIALVSCISSNTHSISPLGYRIAKNVKRAYMATQPFAVFIFSILQTNKSKLLSPQYT